MGDGITLRLTGGTWSVHSNQGARSLALSGTDSGWALSNSGILRLSGGAWTKVRDDLRNGVRLAPGTDSEGWATAEDGRLLRLHGRQWYRMSSLSGITWRSVALSSQP